MTKISYLIIFRDESPLASQSSFEILQEIKKVKHYGEVDPRLIYCDMMDRLSRSISM